MVNSIFIAPFVIEILHIFFLLTFSAFAENHEKNKKCFTKKQQHLFHYMKCSTYTSFSSAYIHQINIAHMAL